jgi:hypothetical protein
MKGFYYFILQALALLFVFSRFSASGQELLEEYADDADYLQLPVPEQYDPNILRNPEIKKTAFTLNTGMMLIAGKSKNYSINTYISAFYRININPRLSIRTGNVFFFPVNNYYIHSVSFENSSLTSFSTMTFFAAADYFATERFTITSTIYKTITNPFSDHKNMPQAINRYACMMPSQSFSLGINYKIVNGLSIGAEIRLSDYYQPDFNLYNSLPGFYQPGPVYW